MHDPDEVATRARIRRGGPALDKSVLKYLREMISVCRRLNRREARWHYEHAWEFAAQTVYGRIPEEQYQDLRPLIPAPPPKPRTFYQVQSLQNPLRKIVGMFDDEPGALVYAIECGHQVAATIGDPAARSAKRRRCSQCHSEDQQAQQQKKPAGSSAPRSKVVSA